MENEKSMTEATLPPEVVEIVNDEERLALVAAHRRVLGADVPELDHLTEFAAEVLNVPVALISLVGDEFQHFQSCFGIDVEKTAVEHSFCAHAIASEDEQCFIVKDATKDQRFAQNPLVLGDPHIRFYAGVPLEFDGHKLGTLCVIDQKPHQEISETQISQLSKLGKLTSSIFRSKLVHEDKTRLQQTMDSMERRHELAMAAANVGTWVYNLVTGTVDIDLKVREMFGIDSQDNPVPVEMIFERIDDEDIERVKDALDQLLLKGEDYNTEFRIKDNGPWLLAQGQVVQRSDEGQILSIAGVNVDITEQKQSERKTQLLLRELNHRVKNTLAMLQSIASQTLKNSRSPEEFRSAFSGRIRSIAAAHTLLSDKEWESVDLQKLLRDQVNVYVEQQEDRIQFSGKQIKLGPEESLAMGLVLHELATNAVKYGALSNESGVVKIETDITLEDDVPFLTMHWNEVGGPPVKPPESRGFGSLMIEHSLDKIIGSKVTLEFAETGVEAVLRLPLVESHGSN